MPGFGKSGTSRMSALRCCIQGSCIVTQAGGFRTVIGDDNMPDLKYRIEIEQESDERWIADVIGLPGVMAYGRTKEEAIAAVEALALRVIADQIEEGKSAPGPVGFACL